MAVIWSIQRTPSGIRFEVLGRNVIFRQLRRIRSMACIMWYNHDSPGIGIQVDPLHLRDFSQSSNRRSRSSRSRCPAKPICQPSSWCLNTRPFKAIVDDLRDGPCATCNSLATSLAVPDADRVSLDSVLAAECADVSGVLCDFHLLHLFSERCTVSEQTVLVCVYIDKKDSWTA